MNLAQLVRFLQLSGHHIEETPRGVWDEVGYGFVRRLPVYELKPPSEEEVRFLFNRRPLLGLYYNVPDSRQGKEGGIYFVRDPYYDIPQLRTTERRKTRRGLENCVVRRMGFDELQRLGMLLNKDTLARQGRDDRKFSDEEEWTRFCKAGEQVEGAEAWGSFYQRVQLASYAVMFRVEDVVSIMYTCSLTDLMNYHASKALIFTVTQSFIRTPGIKAVCFGPEGLSGSRGLDDYKQRMGYRKEPVRFAVRLRSLVRVALLNPVSRHVVQTLNHRYPNSDTYRRIQRILDIATASPSRAGI